MKVLCFARIRDPDLFRVLEFYTEDVAIIERLGFEVVTEHRIRVAVRSDAEVVYAWWGASALPVLLVLRALGRRCVLTGAVGFRDAGDRRRKRWPRSVLILIASKVAHCTLAVSEFELHDLHRFGIRNARLAYHSVDTDYFEPGPKSPLPSAVTVGQLNLSSIARKGIETSIAATALVRRAIPTFELTVAGLISDDGHGWLEHARSRYDFTGVNVVGDVDRDTKRSLLQSAWVYLQPSRYEAFGVAVAEAMACGTPAIHSLGGALPEVAGDGGVRIDRTCTPERLAAAIVATLSAPVELRELSARARRRSLDFARASRRESLAAAFDSVLGRISSADGQPFTTGT
jgi:glycosyltransferase involved in cell wall biosynthesis